MKVLGIYDGEIIRVLEPIALAPNTQVEILIPDAPLDAPAYWEQGRETGIISPPTKPLANFHSIKVAGESLSDTILRERRSRISSYIPDRDIVPNGDAHTNNDSALSLP